MFEDSKTDLYVSRIANGTALRSALTAGMGGFYLTGANNVPFVGATLTAGAEFEYSLRNTRGVLRKSPTFRPEQIVNATYMATTARVEQVTYLGYNGTSGSMDAANSTYYGLQVVLNHTFGMLNNSPLTVTIPYKSSAAATQYEVANGLATAARAVFKRQNNSISVTVINSGALLNAVAAGGAATAAVVNGSNTITFSSDQTTVVSAGSILRLGATGAGTAAVYKVISTAASGVTVLDRPYEGATNAAYGEALIETVTEGNYGLRFVGVSVTDANFNPITDEPFVVSFTLQTGDFTIATTTYTTNPFIGRGTYQLVSAKEAYTQFQDKTREVSRYPQTSYNIEAQAGDTFGTFSFEVLKQDYIDAVTGQRPISKVRIELAVLTGIAQVAEFITVLGASLAGGAILTGSQN